MPASDGLYLGETLTPRRWDGSRLLNVLKNPLTENLNFAGYQALDLALEKLTANPTLRQGRLWLRSDQYEPHIFYSPDAVNVRRLQSDKHTHVKNYESWEPADDTEVSTSSTTWVTLIESIAKPHTMQLMEFIFTHNVKNEGTLASRGADFRITMVDDTGELEVAGFRWTDALADYKTMSVCVVKLIFDSMGNAKWRIQWKVDNAAYPCWSKNRWFVIRSYDQGGYVQFEY